MMSDNEFKKILKDPSFIKQLEQITKHRPILKPHVEKLQNKNSINKSYEKKNSENKKQTHKKERFSFLDL